jgi:3-phenylpropionate/trans-cinnamate dioxygenase ferredoxin subunit
LICLAESEGYVAVAEEKDIIEGKMRLVRVEGIPVLIIRRYGEFCVIDDRCPHMGCKFSNGSLDGDFIVCPCHDWRFNLKTREYENQPNYMLTTYPFKVEVGKIWVKVEEDF